MRQIKIFYLMSCLLKGVRLVYIMVKEAMKELENCYESFIVRVIFDKQDFVLVNPVSVIIEQFGLFYDEMCVFIKSTTIKEVLKLS